MRAGEERPRRSDERSDLGECQGWRQSLQVVATQARTARRSSQDGGIFSREALAPALPARPWPNLRGDGQDECRAGARAEHQAVQGLAEGRERRADPQGPGAEERGHRAAVGQRKRGCGLQQALRGRGSGQRQG